MVSEAARDRKRTTFAVPASPPPPSPTPPVAPRATPRLPVELDALRGHVAPDLLAWAHGRARALRVGGDEVLICAGHLSPDAACAHAAAHLGLAVDPLTTPPVPPDLAPDVLRLGTILAPGDGDGAGYVFAARGLALRRLARALKHDPALARRARLVTPERLHAAMARHGRAGIGREAAFALRTRWPELSAAMLTPSRRALLLLAMAGVALIALTVSAPLAALLLVEALLSVVFLAGAALRLAACLVKAPREVPLGLGGADLPPYSVIVPLYREVRVLPRLVAALRRLDYPPEKLDIKLVIEPDDAPMRAALRRMALPPWFEVVVAPAVGPRTKPKALNAALPFARGSYVAVFDAEDVPAPDQLRRALAAFRGAGPAVACVQARLTVENAEDSWISRHFAAEYAGQFDVLLPALASLGLPVLLGGTSNHFRRDILEAVGAWDPFNVTEDADLGVRLARAGWTTAVIASSTEEEAPISRQAWMGQRTRWLKGWAQTLLVHGRNPRRLGRDLGWGSMLALALLTAGPFASALLHPLCLIVLAADVARGVFLMPSGSALGVATTALSATTLVVGYLATGLCCALGLKRRGRLGLAPVLLSLPAYWLLLSVAAWRAVVELVVRPHWWDKTEHGLGRRRPVPGGRRTRGRPEAVRDSASARPPPRPEPAWC